MKRYVLEFARDCIANLPDRFNINNRYDMRSNYITDALELNKKGNINDFETIRMIVDIMKNR